MKEKSIDPKKLRKVDPKKLRKVAACFATGVTVVGVKNPAGKIHGMTASSFLSVSLAPPLVLFSLMNENQMTAYLSVDTPLGISILTEEMQALSNHFAKISRLDSPPEFVFKHNAPVLKNPHAWYATRVEQLIPAGDHTLVLCRVVDLEASPEENPLLYYQGYKKIAGS